MSLGTTPSQGTNARKGTKSALFWPNNNAKKNNITNNNNRLNALSVEENDVVATRRRRGNENRERDGVYREDLMDLSSFGRLELYFFRIENVGEGGRGEEDFFVVVGIKASDYRQR